MRNSKFFCAATRNSRLFLAATKNLGFVLAAVVLFFFSSSANAQLQRNDSERQLFDSLNRERTAQGLSPLQWDNALFKAARLHALLMLNLNKLEHQLPAEPTLEARFADAGARFAAIAENIAVGANPQNIHNGWMNSPGHRRNILNPQLTSVGIAAVRGAGGIYAVQDFSQAVPDLSVDEQEKKVATFLAANGIHVKETAGAARKTCEGDAAFPDTGAKSMVRFETGDLNKLPEEIERKILSRPSVNAMVGACRENNEKGFTRYRIAILFF